MFPGLPRFNWATSLNRASLRVTSCSLYPRINEEIDVPCHVLPDFRAVLLIVDFRIPGIHELIGHEIFAGFRLCDFLSFFQACRQAFVGAREKDLPAAA